jgi:phosphatidylglycerophosphatase A
MPGTYASAATAAACLLLAHAGVPLVLAGAAAAVLGSAATVLLGAPRDGDGGADPGWVVSDEVAGQGLAVLGAASASSTAAALAVSFVVFRALDIAKPPPVGTLERLPGALGVLADDLGAGALAGAATFAVVAAAGL